MKNNSSSTPKGPRIDREDLLNSLSYHEVRSVLEAYGFDFSRSTEKGDRWNNVLGPSALGEGEKPNFSISHDGRSVKDWGSSGYSGSIFDVVMEINRVDFPEALRIVAEATGYTPRSTRYSLNGHADFDAGDSTPRPTRASSPPDPPAPDPGAGREAVTDEDTVATWHRRLMSDTEEGRAARRYLNGRGISDEVLAGLRIGLAYTPHDSRSTWWIMIPVTDRTADRPTVVAVKGFGFDLQREAWTVRNGRKVVRSGGSAALLDLCHDLDAPVLDCEGPTDALCALSHGYNAVTGTGGAGTWKDEWSGYLANLKPVQDHGVVICYDGDAAGRKGAATVADSLRAAGIDVKVADLPDGADVNDVLVDGGREALDAIIEDADPYHPPEPDTPPTDAEADDPEALVDPLRSDDPLTYCEPIPNEAFAALPSVLDEPTSWWSRRHKRDVFLTSALGILSGCLPNVRGWWGADKPTQHGPNLYMAFVAGAAGGKSAGNHARELARKVHEQITDRSESRIAKWEDRKADAEETDEPFNEPKPDEQSLWVPANSSYAALLHTLNDNDGSGIVFSSEIDTVADALGQDWGNFDSLLRKAYHHEADDQGRRETGNIRIEEPHVSLVMGGTDRQFVSLVGSAENGLYSRLCLYYFDAADGYQSQRPTREGIERAQRLDELADKVGRLWTVLDARETPLKFQLEDHQWPMLDAAVEPLHQETQRHGFSHLLSIPRRSGLWAFRIAMILTVLRAHETGVPLGQAATLAPTDEDLQAALTIASTYADHALRFGRQRLEDGEHRSPKDLRISVMLAGTDEQFSSRDAYGAARADGIDVSDRTLRRDLLTAANRGLLERISETGWRKR